MESRTPSTTGSNVISWEERGSRVNDLSQLLERAVKQPELLATDAFRRRFSRLVRHELAESSRLDVLDTVERRLAAAPAPVADAVRELLSISLMPTTFPLAAPGLTELLAALSGSRTAHEAGRLLLDHFRGRFGPHVGGQVAVARPRPEVVATSEPSSGPSPFTAHWAEGDRELGHLKLYGLAEAERETVFELVPWLQPTFKRLSDLELERQAMAESHRLSRGWQIKAELLQLIQSPQSAESYLRQAVAVLDKLFGAEQVLYWAYVAEDDSLEVRLRARPEGTGEPGVTLGLFQEAIENRSVKTAAVTLGDRLRTFFLVPIFAEDELEGVLQVVMPDARLDTGAEADLALASEYLAAGLKTVRFYEQLSYHASHDPLTGLANRRTFEQFLDREFRLSSRHGAPISVMILDLDHFKRYNDAFGHPAGDALLVAMSRTLTEVVRSTDFVARLGGEEFAIVLPHTDAEGAVRVAEKVLSAVRTLHEHESKLCRPITASMGAASFPGTGEGVAALIEAADQALYRAKRAGRDRVEV